MLDFILSHGVKLLRSPYWPDYYDTHPGGSAPGRTVVAALFNINELGPWTKKLRPNYFTVPSIVFEATRLPLIKVSWQARWIAFKAGLRSAIGPLIGARWVTAGAALMGRMLQAALKAGVEFRTDSPVKEIILEDGVAVGVVTVKDGRAWRIGSRTGILLNAGGFAQNQEMLNKYIPNVLAEWSHAADGDTGDMHRELMRLGAAMAQMEEMVGNQMVFPPGMGVIAVPFEVAKPNSFIVDQSGTRYMSEGGSYMEVCKQIAGAAQDGAGDPELVDHGQPVYRNIHGRRLDARREQNRKAGLTRALCTRPTLSRRSRRHAALIRSS